MTTSYPLTKDQLQQLLQLRNQLAMFRTTSCRLAHEQVNKITETTCTTEHPDGYHVHRMGLCRPGLRKTLLGCAHTGANDQFCQLIDKAFAPGLLRQPSPSSLLLNEIIVTIYRMDHEKGKLEKELAIARYNGHKEAVHNFENALAEILVRYSDTVARLETMRQTLLDQIDAAIGTTDQHQPDPL